MAYNEYSTRFFFRFESNAGREFRIDIKKRNYTGVAEQRHLGQTPVLKRENGNSGIYGTSLEIYAECRIDGEFAELYTSDAKEFLVVLSEVSNGATTAIWHGFNTPELYAEPEVAPPYDVQIIATDGLGELKLYNFQPAGRQTLFYFIQNLLQYSGLVVSQSDVIVVDSLACVTPSVTAPNLLTGIQVDLDYLAAEGKSCYDVLSSLLTTLNLTLTRYADKWLLVRESDIEIDGGFVYGRTVSGTEVTLPVAQYGSMRNHRWYPVGRIDTDIEPAKNSLTVALPFKMRESMLNNPNLPDGTGWTYPTREQDPGGYVSWALFANDERRPYLWMVSQDVYIYQDIPVEQYAGMLTLALLTWDFTLQGARPNQYRVHYRIKLTSGNTTYWLKVDDNSTTWETSEKTNSYKCQRAILAEHQSSDTVSVNSFDRTEIQIPGIPASGTLRVEIIGKAKLVSLYADSFAVGGVFLTQDTVPGYKDEIAINNGARGSLSEIGVDFGDAPYAPNALTNLQNILTGGASTLTSDWKTSRFTGELLSVISMDYALSVALPRLKAHGTVNVPANADLPVAFINPSDIPMLIMTSSWKILTDDLDIELISCPAAEISILSQNIREMSKEEATSVGGSTAAAGSGGGSSVVPTQPQYFVPIEEEDSDEIESIKALYDISIIQQEADEEQGIEEVIKNISEILRHLFLVNNNGTLYLRSDISFYSDYAVSAGGISDTGGGGGGGIDADAMWRLLADSTNEQINASHLTNALDQYASKAWVEAQGYIRAEDIPGIVDPLAITTALAAASTRLDSLEEWTNRPYIEELATDVINTRRLVFDGQAINYIATDEDILDLAVQQAGHDARLEALESWIASPYAAEMTAAALHVERSIDLGGLTLDYDYANNAWHVHGNFYSDGFISAGGISSTGGGSGGGIDPAAMWSLLAAGTNEQINASHLTGVLSPYATRQWVEAHGYITSTDITSAAVITALGYTPAADDDLHPLAASLAGQSERISAIEAWLSRAYLEDLTTSDLRVERSITLGGTTLVYDYGVGAWHLKGSIYADGFVSAGGYSGSESEGGINEAAMWRLLAVDTDEQISISHLTDALTPYATQAWVEAQGYSLTAEAIAIALTYVPVSPDDLLPLSVSLSAESSRLDAIESWIASPYAAEMTAAALHVERSIDLGGLTLDYDYANNAWHVHGNLYSDGFISAGGMSPVISSGGIDANAMWALLADTTGEPIAASHLPLSVSLSEGNYVQGISYANGIFTVVRATLPDSMKNPAALNFGSKSYDGSTAVSLTASDLGAITYVRNFGQTLTRGTTKTIATVGSTDITVTVPNFAFASDIPTLLPNPYALTFGSKTYDGSAARTITASDLGALTTHQRIYSLRIYNSAGSSVLYYIPTYGDETLTLTKAMVGLGNVDNTALSTWSGSSYITTLGTITSGTWNGSAIANSYLANSSITLAGRSVSLGGSISKGTMLSDLGLSSATSDISTLFGYFTNGVANSAARLSGTASKTAWGQTFWSSGTPDSVSGAMSSVTNINALLYFYNSDTRLGIGTSRPAYALDVAGSIQASSDIIAGGYIYIGGTSAYIRYVSTNAGLNVNVGLYSNSYISAGGLSSSSDRRLKTDIRSIDDRRAWSVISKLRPVEFRWITTGEQCSGLIAQEVEPYLPEAVTEVGGIKRLRYDVVFTYGLAALNSLRLQASSTQRRIDTLERRVRTLEQELRINNKS